MLEVNPQLPDKHRNLPVNSCAEDNSTFKNSNSEFLAIDDPLEWPLFSTDLSDEKGPYWESYMAINGIYCAACSLTIESALMVIPGVKQVEVSATNKKAKIRWRPSEVLPSVWLAALEKAGYQALPHADASTEKIQKQETRQALWRWLVAGLCMMQVMMYAYPSYVNTRAEMGPGIENILRWASWLLSIPVLIFSSGPFFKKALQDLKHKRISMDLPITLGILITFIMSMVGTFEPDGIFGGEVYFDSLTMFVFFLLSGRLLELKLRDRVFADMSQHLHQLPVTVKRVAANGQTEAISSKRIRVGDVLLAMPNELFAADGVLATGPTTVSEAMLTGEADAIFKNTQDTIISGSQNLSQEVQYRVTAVGQQTRLGQIMALMASAQTSKPSLSSKVDAIAKPFLIGVLLIAFLTAVYWWPTQPSHALIAAVAVLIVTCPCALSLATPAALLASMGLLARNAILTKRLSAIEALSKVDLIVFDKTGTLTDEKMVVSNIVVRQDLSQQDALILAASLAKFSMHPVSQCLFKSSPSVLAVHSVQEIVGQGVKAFIQDANHLALGQYQLGTSEIRLGSADFCNIHLDQQDTSKSQVFLSDASGCLASFTFQQTFRQDAKNTVQALQQLGLEVAILSGDQVSVIEQVSQELGVALAKGACSPLDKLDFVRAQQALGRKVAVIGDGMNDAPVLAAADVSISIGSATPIAQSQADFLLLHTQLFDLLRLIKLSKRTVKIVNQNLTWAIAYNLLFIPMAVMAYMPAWLAGLGMATSSLLVILNAARLSTWSSPEALKPI